MALGAGAREVLVLRQSLAMIGSGVGARLFAALVVAALISSFAAAVRASGVDPIAALRGDQAELVAISAADRSFRRPTA